MGEDNAHRSRKSSGCKSRHWMPAPIVAVRARTIAIKIKYGIPVRYRPMAVPTPRSLGQPAARITRAHGFTGILLLLVAVLLFAVKVGNTTSGGSDKKWKFPHIPRRSKSECRTSDRRITPSLPRRAREVQRLSDVHFVIRGLAEQVPVPLNGGHSPVPHQARYAGSLVPSFVSKRQHLMVS
jgi:hypothetical protein